MLDRKFWEMRRASWSSGWSEWLGGVCFRRSCSEVLWSSPAPDSAPPRPSRRSFLDSRAGLGCSGSLGPPACRGELGGREQTCYCSRTVSPAGGATANALTFQRVLSRLLLAIPGAPHHQVLDTSTTRQRHISTLVLPPPSSRGQQRSHLTPTSEISANWPLAWQHLSAVATAVL